MSLILKRREFVKQTTLAFTAAAASGAVWWGRERGVFLAGDGPAFKPWHAWQAEAAPYNLRGAGVLSASPHNTQPWVFRTTAEGSEIRADPARNSGALDPFLREQHIGLGCALENCVIAARANGYATTVQGVAGALDTTWDYVKPHRVALL